MLLSNLARSLPFWDSNPSDVVVHMTALLKLPANVLTKPSRGGKHRASPDELSKRRLDDTALPDTLRDLAETIWSSHSVLSNSMSDKVAGDTQHGAKFSRHVTDC